MRCSPTPVGPARLGDVIVVDLGIAGRVAFAGGASSGLVLASALRLAEAGCRLLILARQEAAPGRTPAIGASR